MKSLLMSFLICTAFFHSLAQNSMVGDGFGGRLWYTPTNYSVGSYSGYTVCGDICTEFNQLYAWGANGTNQLGLGSSVEGVNTPTPIPNMSNLKYYSTGYIMGAIKNDNTGWAWGNSISTPTQVISDVKFLDAGSTSISYVKTDGTVWSIGFNGNGNFGNGLIDNSDSQIPVQMQNITNAVRVANNYFTTCVLLADGTVVIAGSGVEYLGLGNGYASYQPTTIPGLTNIIDIKSNASGTAALTANGEVYYWGSEVNSSLSVPTNTSLNNIVAISGCDDGYHFLALDENNNCYVWGYDFSGNTGAPVSQNAVINAVNPILVATDVIDIMAGETFSYIVKSDNSLWATGSSNYGGSIWLNLTDETRTSFTKLSPDLDVGNCESPGVVTEVSDCTESHPGSILINNIGGQAPFEYSIGNGFQSSNYFDNLSSGTYMVTVIDTNGCQYSDEVVIDSQGCGGYLTDIHFPNVFTPNSDETNNVFYFPNSGVQELDCKILNRWGNIVATLDNPQDFWDGRTSDNLPCAEGVYYYVVNYRFKNGAWETKHGHISLVR